VKQNITRRDHRITNRATRKEDVTVGLVLGFKIN